MSKYYAVRKGRTPGVYMSWTECDRQVNGFSGAEFKKFPSFEHANAWISQNNSMYPSWNHDTQVEKTGYPILNVPMPIPSTPMNSPNSPNSPIYFNSNEIPSTSEVKQPIYPEIKSFSILENKRPYYQVVYTDGACRNNGKNREVGGIGVYFGPNDPRNVSRKITGNVTNNRAEMMAALTALIICYDQKQHHVEIRTDSKYVIRGIQEWMFIWKRNGWKTSKGGQVKNSDLWKKLDFYVKDMEVLWTHVRGHSGIAGNEMADTLATQCL